MNEIVNTSLLAGDKFMVLLIVPAVHAQKIKKELKSFMQTGNTDFFYKNELDKSCFQHHMAYGK